jgi:ABC-type branched-subunit amino acid transport system ATPase component/branched-subunit amino acid ABC-type transport system permease component
VDFPGGRVSQHVNFLLLGLASGAVFAALGVALVVTYRSSGVMNFATSSIGLFGAFIYAGLREGEFVFLVPGLPGAYHFGHPLGFWPAALITLLTNALLGLLLYVAVFRPMRAAPAVAKAVASLGLMVLLTGVMTQRRGTVGPALEPIFPRDIITVGDFRVSKDRLFLALSVVGIAAAVWALTRFTRFGLATRAAAASEKGAYLSGISPDALAALNWMLSAAVAGAAGILVGSVVPLIPTQYTLFIVPALATAILGRFERLLPTVLGGLAIGMISSELTFLQVQHDWLPSSGLSELVPLVLILAVLVVRAKPLPTRGVILRPSLGRAPRPRSAWRPAVPAAVAAVAALFLFEGVWRGALVTSMVLALVGLSYVVVTGYSGQISLAQLTLAGVAAFLLAPMSTTWELPIVHTTIPFPLAPVVAALGATVVGVVIAIPAVRIRGLPVAVVTLALAVVLEAIWFRNSDFVPSSGKPVSGPDLFGLDLSPGLGTKAYPRPGFSLLVLAVLVATGIAVASLRRSPLGARMLAVRANERSAATAGIDVVRTKIVAFAIGGFIAGLGGSLLAYLYGNVSVASYSVFLGLAVFATAYLAGITSVYGGLNAGLLAAGGLVFVALDHAVSLGRWYSTFAGVGLIFAAVGNPEGIVGPVHELIRRRRTARLAPDVSPALHAGAEELPPARPIDPHAPPALSLRGVSVRYGGVVAVDDVSFDVPAGAIVGLIGPNGAGKTTLIDAICGFVTAAGTVQLDDRPLDGMGPHRRARTGLARTFQAIELYEDLTVDENVAVGQAALAGRAPATEAARQQVFELLGLGAVRHTPAGELSQGTRQLVSIARALVGAPSVLVLDEPAAGLDSTESRWLGERLRHIRDSGVTILICDHDMQLVLGLCDLVVVLNFGSVIASGTPAEVRADETVAEAYLGRTHGGASQSTETAGAR